MRPLLCFSRARLRSGLLRLSLLGSHITLRGGLVLLSLAFLLHRLVPGYGPERLLGPALHVFRDAFDPCSRSRLIRHDRLPSFPHVVVLSSRLRALPATRRSGAQTERVSSRRR